MKSAGEGRWYYATLIVKIEVEGNERSVVHLNTVLVRAEDAESAYERAMELGQSQGYEDVNPEGKKVVASFVGLRELDVILDDIEHGSELFYTERVGLAPNEIEELARPRDALALFADPEQPSSSPFTSEEVMTWTRRVVRGVGPGSLN